MFRLGLKDHYLAKVREMNSEALQSKEKNNPSFAKRVIRYFSISSSSIKKYSINVGDKGGENSGDLGGAS